MNPAQRNKNLCLLEEETTVQKRKKPAAKKKKMEAPPAPRHGKKLGKEPQTLGGRHKQLEQRVRKRDQKITERYQPHHLPSLAQKLWSESTDRPLHLFLLTKRLGASKKQAEAAVDRSWLALPLWARKGLKKLAHSVQNRQRFMSDREVSYYGLAPLSPSQVTQAQV